MEFGVWDHFERRRGIPIARQYHERIRLIATAEEYGFAGYQIAEHHLTPLDMAPSQTVFLSAVAQHTQRIRLGTMVFCLPLYHPVRLVQEICMLDQICEGRFMPGVGRGIRDVEHEWFGLDPAEAGSRFEETFAVIVRGLAVGRLDFEGRYYRFKGVPLDLEPLQRPYPPFWYAGNLEAAGRRGLNALGGGRVRRESLERYWELWQESRRAPEPVNPQQAAPVVGSTRHMFLADTDAEAVAVARRAWGVYRQNFNATSTRVGGVEVGRGSDPVVDAFERAVRGGSVLAGSPDSIREQVASYLDEVGPLYNYFAGAFQWGDISHEEALHSIGLFATQVMPSLAARSARGVTV